MKFSKMKMISLVSKLGDYLNSGFDHYNDMKAKGVVIDAETLSVFVAGQMKSWEPKISGKELLDPETKKAACRFVAGVALNLAK